MLFGLVETRTRAAAQLLGAQRGNVHIQEAAFDRRRLGMNNRFVVFRGLGVNDRIHLRDFSFGHSLTAYPGWHLRATLRLVQGDRGNFKAVESVNFRKMLELIALAGLFIAGLAVMAVVGVIFLVFKIVLFAVFLPFRLLFKLMWVPFGLIGGAFSLLAGVAILPILLIIGVAVAVIGAIAALLALVVPMIPFILLGLMIWAFMRKRPATA